MLFPKCKYRKTIKIDHCNDDLISRYENIEYDLFSVCTNCKIVNGCAEIKNPLVCIDCKLRSDEIEGDDEYD